MVKFGRNMGMAVIHRCRSDSGNVYGARVDFDGRSIGHMPFGVIVGGMDQFKMVAHTTLPFTLGTPEAVTGFPELRRQQRGVQQPNELLSCAFFASA